MSDNLKKMKDLEEAIVKYRQVNSEKYESHIYNIFAEMYMENSWIILPCFHDRNNKPYIKLFGVPEHEEFGRFITIFTDSQYFNKVFGTDMLYVGIKKAIEIMNSYGEKCNGLIINPATFTKELVLFKEGVNDIINL